MGGRAVKRRVTSALHSLLRRMRLDAFKLKDMLTGAAWSRAHEIESRLATLEGKKSAKKRVSIFEQKQRLDRRKAAAKKRTNAKS